MEYTRVNKMKKVIKRIKLNKMPFSRVDTSTNQCIPATGYLCKFTNGDWQVEYENSNFIDSHFCKNYYEDDENGVYIDCNSGKRYCENEYGDFINYDR